MNTQRDQSTPTTSRSLIAVLLALVLCAPIVAFAASPPAGTAIGNQASATYTDSTGVQRQVTSNVALTTVQQVAALLLAQDQSKFVSPGGQVVFPHTLTNTGNGTDTFALAFSQIATDNFDLASVHIYPDVSGSGVPSSYTDIASTGPLPSGAIFHFVVVGNVPNSATSLQSGQLSVRAQSAFTSSLTATNLDTARISNQAVINLTKATTLPGGNPGTTNTYTLTYVNVGNNTAGNLYLADTVPAGMTYVSGSGRWSVSGNTALTDVTGPGDPAGIDYSFDNVAGRVNATVATVAPGNTGYLTFQIVVNTNTAPGVINNTGYFTYDDGSGTTITNQPSNTVGFNVNQIPGVRVDDNPQQGGDPALDKVVEVLTAPQGGTVVFSNQVHNTGNGADSFQISVNPGNFPVGTTFQLYQGDANTPLVNSVTGPVNAGSFYTVVVKAVLPPNVTGGPFTNVVTATSVASGTVSDSATDKLDTILAASVDLTANAPLPGAPGAGLGPEASPVVTTNVNPGVTTRFALYVNNTNAIPDTYTISLTNSLPAGWVVQFKNGGGSIIANTGVVPAGGNVLVYAEVTVPAIAPPGNNELFFQALSPTTNAKDVLHARIAVNTIHAITITPDNNGQVTAGGVVFYPHQLCNNGNVAETITLSATDSQAGWNNVLYLDANGNSVYDTNDTVIASVALAANACTNLYAKVNVPAGAVVASQDATTITGATAGNTATATATDRSTVVASNLLLLKEQGLDVNCDGSAVTFGTTPLTIGAVPGACIRYRITATNNGVSTNTNVHVYDTTPPFTTYVAGGGVPAAVVTGGIGVTAPAPGNAGTFDFNIGTMSPNSSATCTFEIKINP